MLTAYVATLVIGGAFVGLSLLSGDGDVDVDMDAGVDLDLDAGLDVDLDLDMDAGVDGPTLGDAAHGLDDRKPKRRFNPLFSMRFWTFGMAGFGLTGVLLSALELSAEPLTAMLAGGVGAILGLGMSAATRALATPVRGETITIEEYVGRTAVLEHAVDPGGITRLRVRIRHRERTLLALTAEPIALPAGASVVILSMDPEGRAVVTPESEIFAVEAPQEEEEGA
jgi:hypothetical protein